jgi:hypothetical protein
MTSGNEGDQQDRNHRLLDGMQEVTRPVSTSRHVRRRWGQFGWSLQGLFMLGIRGHRR